MPLTQAELQDLRQAVALLETPGLTAKITHLVGRPLEKGMDMLPARWNAKVQDITRAAITKAADAALFTLKDVPGHGASPRWHKVGAAVSGGVGGFFGLAALAVELPVSTTLMLRSIADVARSQGERLSEADTRAACIAVLALGGPQPGDDATDSGYYAVRTLLARSVSEASQFLAQKAATKEGAPALVRLVALVAQRFGVQVSEKAMAQAVPALGAAGGALVNTLFIDHFQDMAKGHFTVRRLERHHGQAAIQALYEEIRHTR